MEIEPREVVKIVKEMDRKKKDANKTEVEVDNDEPEELQTLRWEDELKAVLFAIEPDRFERLAQRILRECGFTQVEVTGKSGDGGIDGKGIIKIAGLVSFHAMFQCKRFQDSVTSTHIRNFRGALQGRADKGIFITTGFFTRDAIKEAHRDGAPPIDLIDGDDLVKKLKELSLGIKIEFVEKVNIDNEWFESI